MISCEYQILRYHPNPARDEHVNLGVLLLLPGEVGTRFARDFRRVQCLDPNADPEWLLNTASDLENRLADPAQREEVLREISRNFSGNVQVTDPSGFEAESSAQALDELQRMYLDAPRPQRAAGARHTGRNAIFDAGIRKPFTEAGVWDLLEKKIPASRYTRPGDDFVFDCLYGFNHQKKIFHAVHLVGDADSAKVLAYTYPRVQEGIEHAEKARATMTAVVADSLDRNSDSIAFALESFQASGILVASVSQMPALAAQARKDLRL